MGEHKETIQIGIVDDHNLFREGIISLIDQMPYIKHVFDVTNEKELFVQLKTAVPDVLLLDLELDGTDGIDITKRLKVEFPDMKIIILTMHKEERMISYLMEIGANAYLLKDTNRQELEEAITMTFKDGAYMNALVSKVILKELKEKTGGVPSVRNSFSLTKREMDILTLISEELTTPEIAGRLFLSTRTVEGYRKNLMSKLGVKNSAGLMLKAVKENIITIN